MRTMIRLAMVADARGLGPYAALVGSILRRTEGRVEVRCWCRGFRAKSFEQGRLKVEFRELDAGGDGASPMEMLGLLEVCEDWDRCFVLPKDAVVLRDLGELADVDFDWALLMGRVLEPGGKVGSLVQDHGLWRVEGQRACLSPQVNLAGMREEDVWSRVKVEGLGVFSGRVKKVADCWGLLHDEWEVPEGECGRRDGVERIDEYGMPWRNGVPAGLMRWAVWDKPWGRLCKAVRREIWRAEQVNWEHLRMGLWDKPEVVEVDPEDSRVVDAMAERGWKVRVLVSPGWELPEVSAFPDVELVDAGDRGDGVLGREVRLGMWMNRGEWLEEQEERPECVVVNGWMDAGEVDEIRRLGYGMECRLLGREWAFGGPAAKVLERQENAWGTGLDAGECLYFWKDGVVRDAAGGGAVEGDSGATASRGPDGGDVKGPVPSVVVVAVPGDGKVTRAWVNSVERNFCAGCEVRIFRKGEMGWEMWDGEEWLDAGREMLSVGPPPEGGTTNARGGPLGEVAEFLGRMGGWEFAFLLRSRVRVVSPVGDELRAGGLVGVLHPAYHEAAGGKLPFDRRAESAARVAEHDGGRYFTGVLIGGGRVALLDALGRMAEMERRNEAEGVSHQWGVESYWNRCLVDTPPEVDLHPGYGRYERQAVEFEWKIGVMPEID